MYFPPDVLAPARRPGETEEDYRNRRRVANEAVEQYLGGQYAYASATPAFIPAAGENEEIDEAVRRGDLKVVVAKAVSRDGKIGRIAVTKGTPYRKPKVDKT